MIVACAANEAYMPHCAAMLDSLLHHNSGISVVFLHDSDVSKESLADLSFVVESQGGYWLPTLIDEELKHRFPDNVRFGQVAWYRILIPELLPSFDRVIYLDADTIIRGALSDLWNMNLQGKIVGAVSNPLYPFMSSNFMQQLGVSQDSYFNSGVLLIDCEKWRNADVTKRLLEKALDQGDQEWPDQNALNAVLKRDVFMLSPEWNSQNTLWDLPVGKQPFDSNAIDAARDNPRIIHFIGPYKPWHYRCKHPYRSLYWRHLGNTPWKNYHEDGRNLRNRVLRLLPEQWGWRVDGWIRRFGFLTRLFV